MDQASNPIRAFIAVDIDDQTRQQLGRLIQQLSRETRDAKVNWVPAENLHLTLAFLGNLSQDVIKPMLHALTQQTEHLPRFTLEFAMLDHLPRHHPHYYAITLTLSPALAALAKAINTATSEFGFEPDKRPFLPHITLGRIKKAGKLIVNTENIVLPKSAQVNAFSLYQSVLSQNGAIYTPIQRFSLNQL